MSMIPRPPTHHRLLALVCGAAVLALAACGSSSGPASAPTATQNVFSNPAWEKAGPTPSISAKMVCQKEAQDAIAEDLGVDALRVTKGSWNRSEHLYSCTYVYKNGTIGLSVKEMSSADETTTYFDQVQTKYGRTQKLNGLGQGAWLLANGDVVARKDYKVLLVDVTGLPKQFAPLMSRSDASLNVAAAILACWSGA